MSSFLRHPLRTCSVTDKCALNCAFCGLHTNPDTVNAGLSLPGDSPIVNLIGGDPLLSPELPALVEQLRNNGRVVNIFTPLYQLPQDISFLSATNIFAYIFSFDEADHDQMAGRQKAFQRLLANITTLADHGLKPILYAHVTQDSIGSLPDLSSFCLQQGLGLWLEISQGFYPETLLSKEDIMSLRYFTRSMKRGWNISKYDSGRMCCAFAPLFTTYREKFRLSRFLAKRSLHYTLQRAISKLSISVLYK